jgi:hypothetical protein
MPLEESREMRLIGEARLERHGGQCRLGRTEQTASPLEPEHQKVLMRCAPDGFPERSREVRRREAGLAREKVHREPRVGLTFHQLEHAAPDAGRETAPRAKRRRRALAGVPDEKLAERHEQRVDESEATRRAARRFGGERTEDMAHLRATDVEGVTQPNRRSALFRIIDETLESKRIDRDADVVVRARVAHTHRDGLTRRHESARARLERDGTIPASSLHLDHQRFFPRIHGEVVMRQREVVEHRDVVASRLEQETGPVERLRDRDASFVPHGDDPSLRPWVPQRHLVYQSPGHRLLSWFAPLPGPARQVRERRVFGRE